MNIEPIKSSKDYETALAEVAALMTATPNTPEGDKLDVLTILIEAYEKAHFSIAPPDPVAAIKFVMEQRGLERKDLVAYLGRPSRVSEILNYKRPLTLTMIRRLHNELDVPAELLIAEPPHS